MQREPYCLLGMLSQLSMRSVVEVPELQQKPTSHPRGLEKAQKRNAR